MTQKTRIRGLINRLARLDAAASWSSDLNPVQRAALEYLASANRFSRSPSHAADYLGTTRGTMSQTLKALVRKNYVVEEPRGTDKRSISYCLTDAGRAVCALPNFLSQALDVVAKNEIGGLEDTLLAVLRQAILAHDHRPFGICRLCRHFDPRRQDGFCRLLSVQLTPAETIQICHEQEPA